MKRGLRRSQVALLLLLILLAFDNFTFGNLYGKRLSQATTEIPNASARICGCKNIEPSKAATIILAATGHPVEAALLNSHPEQMMPHYAEANKACSGRDFPEKGANGWVRFSQVATLDLPIDHEWHDLNFYVAFDKPYGDPQDPQNINSDGNYKTHASFLDPLSASNNNALPKLDERLMEVEWDSKYIPEKFWPQAGDRLWILGRYIWDCGHPDAYHTEIHPPTALAFTRYGKDTTGLAASNNLTAETRVYIHGRSGITYFDNFPIPNPAKFGFYDTAVANKDYEFDIELPPNADPNRQVFAKLMELPYGGPEPVLDVKDANTTGKIHVTYPLNLGDLSPDRRFAAIIVSGWKTPIPNSPVFRKVTVFVDKLVIYRRHTLLCNADWNLWLNVNGQFTKIPNTFGVFDGASITIKKPFIVDVPNSDDARLNIQVTGWVSIVDPLFSSRSDPIKFSFKSGDLFSLIPLDHDDITSESGHIGIFFRSYGLRKDNFGVGKDFTGYPGDLSSISEEIDGEKGRADTQGDFALFYKITE